MTLGYRQYSEELKTSQRSKRTKWKRSYNLLLQAS